MQDHESDQEPEVEPRDGMSTRASSQATTLEDSSSDEDQPSTTTSTRIVRYNDTPSDEVAQEPDQPVARDDPNDSDELNRYETEDVTLE